MTLLTELKIILKEDPSYKHLAPNGAKHVAQAIDKNHEYISMWDCGLTTENDE